MPAGIRGAPQHHALAVQLEGVAALRGIARLGGAQPQGGVPRRAGGTHGRGNARALGPQALSLLCRGPAGGQHRQAAS